MESLTKLAVAIIVFLASPGLAVAEDDKTKYLWGASCKTLAGRRSNFQFAPRGCERVLFVYFA